MSIDQNNVESRTIEPLELEPKPKIKESCFKKCCRIFSKILITILIISSAAIGAFFVYNLYMDVNQLNNEVKSLPIPKYIDEVKIYKEMRAIENITNILKWNISQEINDMNSAINQVQERGKKLFSDSKHLISESAKNVSSTLEEYFKKAEVKMNFTAVELSKVQSTISKLHQKKVVIIGGKSDHNKLKPSMIFDLVSNVWSTFKIVYRDKKEQTLSYIISFEVIEYNNDMFILGGRHSDNVRIATNSLKLVDEKGNWVDKKPMLRPRYHFGSAIFEGKIYACGGGTGHLDSIESCEIYNIKENAWEQKFSLQNRRSEFKMVCLDGFLYVIGDGHSSKLYKSVKKYDIKNPHWYTVADLKQPRKLHAAVVFNGKIVVVGGFLSPNTAEIYDPVFNKWTELSAKLNQKRHSFGLINIEDKTLLAFGGEDHQNLLDSVEEYDHLKGEWKILNSYQMKEPRCDFGIAVIFV